jgi:uncharacterized protein YbjT (DUF2867 family)
VAGPIVVAGATGALGGRICRELEARGADVRELRRPAIDLTAPQSLDAAVAGAACVVSTATCFPRDATPGAIERVDRDGNIALVDAAERAGVPRFVFVSFAPLPLDFPLQRAKRAVEERLAAARPASVVLRPAPFMDIWFSPLLGFDAAARRAVVYGDGAADISWIAAADVAAIAALAALGAGPREGTLSLGGPEQLSQREAVEAHERATGGPWELETVPAEELERRARVGPGDVERSLASLMLQCHIGVTVPLDARPEDFPVRPTTVAEFAAASSAARPAPPVEAGLRRRRRGG